MEKTWSLTQEAMTPFGKIAYDILGGGDPLVMVHGTPFSSYVWRKLVPILSRQFRVYVYDLLGYGQSEQPDGDVSLGVQSRVLASLLDRWQLEQPTIIAHDFGGATTLRTHLLEKRDFARMLLIDPVAVAPWGSPFVQHVRAHITAFEGMPPYIHDGILNAYIQDAAFRPLTPDALAAYKSAWTGTVGQPAFYRQIAQMDQRYTDEIEPLYGDIRCPVRLFWGAEDGWIPLAHGQKLRDMVPGATLQILPEAAHLVQEDQPELLLAGIAPVLGVKVD